MNTPVFFSMTSSNNKFTVMTELNLDEKLFSHKQTVEPRAIHTHAGEIHKNLHVYSVTSMQLVAIRAKYENNIKTSF